MKAFTLEELQQRQATTPGLYQEFLREHSLSMGLYVLPAGAEDPQSPHNEDEVYYVVSGRAMLQVDDKDRPVSQGSIVFVAAGAPHRFHTITETLSVLVFFAPAESE